MAGAHKELTTEFVLQLLDATAQRRLAYMQEIGRLRETTAVGNLDEVAEAARVHGL
jgi:hypothetical protein